MTDNLDEWIREKNKALKKGAIRIPIWFFFCLMKGLNRNWIPAQYKKDYLRQMKHYFDLQFRECEGGYPTLVQLVAIDNNYQDRLQERLALPTRHWISGASLFSKEQRVLIGNRYAVAYRMLEMIEQELPQGKSILWLCQEFPTSAAPEYPIRIAQLEFGASVLTGYFPIHRKGGGYFDYLRSGGIGSGLSIVQLKNRRDITADSKESGNLFIETLNAVLESRYQIVFIHLDEGTTESELNVRTEIG